MIKTKNKLLNLMIDAIIYLVSVILLEVLVKDIYAEGRISENIATILITVLGVIIVLRCIQFTIGYVKKYKKLDKLEKYEFINKIELISLLVIEIAGIIFLFNFFFIMDYSLIPTIIFSATAVLILYAIYTLINGMILRLISETKIRKSILSIILIFFCAMLITKIRTNIIAIVLGTILTFIFLGLHTKKVPIVSLIIYSALLMVAALNDPYFGFTNVIAYMIITLTFVFIENEVKKLIDKLFEYEKVSIA